MNSSLPTLQRPSPALPRKHVTGSPPGAATVQRAVGSSTLHERLVTRHREAIEAFRTSARSFNNDVDSEQQERVALLHTAVAESHATTLSTIAQEQQRLAERQAETQAHNEALRGADPDAVLPVCADVYHCSTADDQGRARAVALMQQDRLSLMQRLVEVRDHYRSRVEAIDACFADIASAEEARRKHIQAAVHNLMDSLTRIAVTSTTESQVLAQRILHHTNEQLGGNYLAAQTMATQLRQRELYKHQHYQRTLVTIYRDMQMCMAQQHVAWCITVLRSALFRRPEGRLQSVQAAGRLISAIRSEAEGLTRGLTEVVDSLEVAQPSATTTELQVCGGSGTNGWLRCFESNVHRPIFVGEDPRAVLEEWQMRVSVLLRHCRARCNELILRVRTDEATRTSVAAELAAHTLEDVEAIARPLGEESGLLQRASLAYSGTDKDGSEGPPGEAGDMLDDALLSLTHAHPGVLAMKQSMAQSAAWALCVPTIEQEGKWFVHLVSGGFRRGYIQFCADAATSTGSMLVSLEGATDVLLASTCGILGNLRELYAQWHEKEMDYRDEVTRLELQLRLLEEELRQQETPAAAETQYTAGLMCLQSIIDAHTRYYEAVRNRVANAAADVLRVGQACVGELSRQAGLSWIRLSSSDVGEALETPQEQLKHNNSADTLRTTTHSSGTISGVLLSSPHKNGAAVVPTSDARPWSTTHGEEFIIDSIAFRFTCVTARSGGASSGNSTAKADVSLEDFDVDDKAASAGAIPGAACQQFYLDLLPELHPAQQDAALFLPQSRVVEWKEKLRHALMEWGLNLQRRAWENWRLYTTAFQADVQRRVMEVLRYHRRRPATLQANVYEARVRELMDTKNRGDKMLSQIAERVTHLQTLKHDCITQLSQTGWDEAFVRERTALIGKVRDAMSKKAVKTLVCRHDSLCAEYRTALADRCAEAVHTLERARAAIEEGCAQLLHDRAVELRGGNKTAQLPAGDPVQRAVDQLRAEVQGMLTQSLKAVDDLQQERVAEIESWQAKWDRTVEHSSAELSVFQTAQEGLARLKTQVQTMLTTAAMEEAALAAEVAVVVKVVDEASVVPVIDLAATMHALFKEDPSATSPAGVHDGETPLTTEDLKDMVEHKLNMAKAMQRDRIRTASVCVVFASLDKLRGLLYERGCRLGLLAHTVEMWRVSPMHYLLPSALGEEDPEVMRSRAGNRSAALKAGRRCKDAQSAASAGHTIMPLSTPATYAEQAAQWTTQVLKDAEAAALRHVSAFPGDMYRRLPGMTDGSAEQFNAAVATLCLAQRERIKSYTTKAGQPFRQRVQELWNALQRTPSLLAHTLRTEATTAILERVGAVLQSWLRFQRQSSEQWRAHKNAVTLSLAHQPSATALTSLSKAEAARSASAESTLQKVWGWSLREVEDEVGLHVARCWTALQSYSRLLKGLVTPQHLVSTADVVEGSHHRGLRHLLELRAQHERAATELEGTTGVKRDPCLQDLISLHRADAPGANPPAASKRRVSSSAAAATAAAAATMESVTLVQLSQWSDIELPGLPLNACVPLSQYNMQHPQTTIAPPLAAAAYVPAATHLTSDGKGPQGPSNRRISGMTSSASASSSGRKGHSSTAADAKVAAAVAEVSVPLLVPRAPLALECAQLLRAVVQSVSSQGNDAAGVLSNTFDFYERQEAQWQQTWALTLKDLATM
ncbi:hypothetical protein LPMP_205710 [Leishmania panamensis]|uniref:hypothetical protein n=1 Tax=Leishmania panamensis TaxID=5679 RepID=UPI0004F87537|nr:hypothetical protein LPMP_205710 [Leishmania panamensis]AIN98062.1 hypothetical protein LPMP_205710 [Leishmania panamensis]